MSRSTIQNLIENGNVIANGKTVVKNYRLKTDDVIDITIPDPIPVEIKPENIPLDIIYEDTDIIIVNKPQDMVVHPSNGHMSGTLVNALLFYIKDSLSGINGVMRPGIVHRIDKDTSGLLIVAKNDKAHQSLALQLSKHTIKRRYYAIACGNLKEDCLTINEPVGRSNTDRLKMAVVKNGKEAITHLNVIARFGKYTQVQAELETGRTHQIRVHMAHIGHPLLGDMTYGYKNQPFKLLGQVLHAKRLEFVHPQTGQYMEFESDLPVYFQKLINQLSL